MKTIMVIGAGKTQMPLIEAAKKEGYHTVVCDLNPDAPGVALADEYCKVSTKDRDGLYRTAQEKKIDGIVANSEYAMCDVAFISQELGLVGNPEEAIAVLSSKTRFRELQERIGLFAPRVDGDLFFPVIIKPDMNSGTRGTTVANDEAEVEAAVKACSALSRNGKAIVEEHIPIDPETVVEGEIFVHNGQMLWDGLFRSIRSKLAPMIPMTYVFPLAEERVQELKGALEAAFQAAGVVHGEYNIEACFVDDKPFIIEINPRQGGNDLPRYVMEHCGIDYYRLLVSTSVGDDGYWESLHNHQRENRYLIHHMLYPHVDGTFKGIQIDDSILDCICHTHLDADVGSRIKKASDGSCDIGYVDLVFPNSVEQMRAAMQIEDLIRIDIGQVQNMVKVEELNSEAVCRYRNEIAQFYYENIRTCSCFEHYSFNEAYEKIGDLINHLSSNTCIVYGAFDGDEIIGYIWAYLHPFREETRMYINEIRVRDEYRNRGIGKELIRMVEERAKELNLPALCLHAEATNPDAIRLYESIGYKTERIQLRKEIM